MARRNSNRSRSARSGNGVGVARWLGLLVLLGLAFLWWRHERSGPSTVTPGSTAPPRPARTNVAGPPAPVPLPPPVAEPVPGNTIPRITNAPVAGPPPTSPPNSPSPRGFGAPASARPVTNILEAQIALTWRAISCGPLDGVGGAQTALALKAFQRSRHLEETGRLDRDTLAELSVDRPLYTRRTLNGADLARIALVPATWLAKSQVPRLDHESVLELVAEETQAHPNFIRRLNPDVNWDTLAAGAELTVPNATFPVPRRASLVRLSLTEKWVRAFDANGQLLGHFPCSIGRIAEKRPVGELHVAVAVKDPNYTFDPEVFPESAEGRQLGRKLVVPPGPNNPVGAAWIGLSKPGYGIHGTPHPEQVGRTESHGCFRLANWNAEYLRQMVRVGTPVWIE